MLNRINHITVYKQKINVELLVLDSNNWNRLTVYKNISVQKNLF